MLTFQNMTSVINEIFERCPSCDRPLSMYQFFLEKELEFYSDTDTYKKILIEKIDELEISCPGCILHIINKPMTHVLDYTRDMKVILGNKRSGSVEIRERGFEVYPTCPVPGELI